MDWPWDLTNSWIKSIPPKWKEERYTNEWIRRDSCPLKTLIDESKCLDTRSPPKCLFTNRKKKMSFHQPEAKIPQTNRIYFLKSTVSFLPVGKPEFLRLRLSSTSVPFFVTTACRDLSSPLNVVFESWQKRNLNAPKSGHQDPPKTNVNHTPNFWVLLYTYCQTR